MNMQRLKEQYMPAMVGAVMSAAITLAVLKNDIDWIKKTLDRHEVAIAALSLKP